MWLLFTEPICLGVLRDKNRCLANRENLDMFGWAKFVGLPFWISKFSRFRKGNFPLQFRYHAICKSWFCQYFLLKTKDSLQSSPFTITSPVLSLHHIYILSSLPQLISFTRIGSLFFVFALLHVSSFFIAIQCNYSPLPIFEFMI